MERESKIVVDFTNCKQADGTYIHNELPPNARCPICQKLFAEHSNEQIRECGRKQQNAGMK
jgi:hypothetical protein